MAEQTRCTCSRCSMRGLMGPVILITLGVLFMIGEYSGRYSFHELWPFILIVIGVVKLLESMASTEGHNSPPASPNTGANRPLS